MDIQKELDNLAKDQQKVSNKYGKRFNRFYQNTVATIASNTRIIDQAKQANQVQDKNLVEVVEALAIINYEV